MAPRGHRIVETNGIRMHVAEQGEGPLVLLCHGFPESWYSWRHQLPALAAAGFRAVAPDMRGYGRTDRPEAVDQYTQLHHVGDMVGLLDALGVETAVIVTESATSTLARYEITFEAVPPGQHATRIRPTAKAGGRSKRYPKLHPKNGITVYCNKTPTPTRRGSLKTL